MWTESDYVRASEEADNLQASGRDQEARAKLHAALRQARKSGNEALAIFFRAELAACRRRYNEALRLHLIANGLNPSFPLGARNIGIVLNHLGRHTEAIDWLNKALAATPRDCRALLSQAVALSLLGKLPEAIRSYDKALKLDPGFGLAMAYKAIALRKLKRIPEAMDLAQRAIHASPSIAYPYLVLGRLLLETRQYKQAINALNVLLRIQPSNARAIEAKGIALGQLGKKQEAVKALRQCLKLDPKNESARMWLMRFGKPADATAVSRKLEAKREQERREAEKKVTENAIKLDAWRSLSARSAHRIGNQMFAAMGALRTLEQAGSPEAREAVGDLRDSINRIRQIVDEFRTFSTNAPAQLRQARLVPLVESLVRRYRALSEKHHLHVQIQGDLPEAQLDPSQIDQALSEILENAFQHSPLGCEIHVGISKVRARGGAKIRISVQDSGPGIPQEDKERIFEPFVTTRPGGSGLGLAIVSQIVHNHGGIIRENGRPGHGARFEIDLPASRKRSKSK